MVYYFDVLKISLIQISQQYLVDTHNKRKENE